MNHTREGVMPPTVCEVPNCGILFHISRKYKDHLGGQHKLDQDSIHVYMEEMRANGRPIVASPAPAILSGKEDSWDQEPCRL